MRNCMTIITARWRSYFWKINKDCFIPLPFDLSEIAYTDNQTILPYVEIANKHIKIWHWPSIFKFTRSICETVSRYVTFARVCLFGIPFLFIAVFIYPVLLAWGSCSRHYDCGLFYQFRHACSTRLRYDNRMACCLLSFIKLIHILSMTWLEDHCYDGWDLRLS